MLNSDSYNFFDQNNEEVLILVGQRPTPQSESRDHSLERSGQDPRIKAGPNLKKGRDQNPRESKDHPFVGRRSGAFSPVFLIPSPFAAKPS